MEDAKTLRAALAGLVDADYRARQIEERIYAGCDSFDCMTTAPLSLRKALAERFTLRETCVVERFSSEDGACKARIRLADGIFIESVLLVDGAGRRTICLSTQAGCAQKCVFCKTGQIGFKRNLSAAEIVEQYFLMSDGNAADNIVVMGMGEPLLNITALAQALDFLARAGKTASERRVTISTSGIANKIRTLPDILPGTRLAVSITTGRSALRARLMPASSPLPALKNALLYYQSRVKKRITLEAALIKGINTSDADAAALVDFARGLNVIVNLIPWNHVDGLSLDGAPLESPPENEVKNFARRLVSKGLKVEIRRKKGDALKAACGQLGAV